MKSKRPSPGEAVARALQAAQDLSAQLAHRRAAHARIAEKRNADKFKGVGRWGSEMFCRLFYSTLKQHGLATRDVLSDAKPQPRYVREMGLVLGLVEDRGRTKEEFASALVEYIKSWGAGLERKLSGKHASVYDLRYHLDDLFGRALPTSAIDGPVDMSDLFQEESENEG